MSDIVSKGNNLKCRRGNRGVRKSPVPINGDLSEIFSSFLNLTVPLESRPLRQPKTALNHASFVERNAEIHQMVVETTANDWVAVPNDGKKQRKKKNKNILQTQEQCQNPQSQDECQEHHSVQDQEKNHNMVSETSDSRKSPKNMKRQRKKKSTNFPQGQKTISIQTNQVSIKTQQVVSHHQTNESNSQKNPQIISAEFNAISISSQESSVAEGKKKRIRKPKKNKIFTNSLTEESSIQTEDGENSLESVTIKKHSKRVFTSSNLRKKSNAEKKSNSEAKSENGQSPSSSKEKKDPEKDKFPAYIGKKDVLQLLKNQPKDNPNLVEGYIRINMKFYKHAYVSVAGNEMDILIVGIRDRNRALEGDLVVVSINPEDKWHTHSTNEIQKTGVIVSILEKNHPRKAIGFIKKHQSGIIFQPRDSRVPYMKIINPQILPQTFHENPKSMENTLFLAKINFWNKPGSAFGRLKQSVGSTGDLRVETNAILLENDLDVNSFDDDLINGLPSGDYVPTEQDLEGREDWRNHCIFTIDPATAKDLDDAVSCQLLVNGNYEVGVHISDVTHYLKAFTALDEKVAERATTVYLVDNVFHMLPKQLCEVCSLQPGRDKLTFSVIWEMTPAAEVVRQRFAKTVINSCCQLSYEQAQAMIDNPLIDWSMDTQLIVKGEHDATQLCEVINDLYKLSLQMRDKRFVDGALRIDQPKLCITLDPRTGYPFSCFIEENKDSNRLIEEFMLLANMSVAKQIYDTMPDDALLRSHKEPSTRILTQTRDMLEKFGIILDIESSGALQTSLTECDIETSSNFATKSRMLVINSLCAKSMTRAIYRCSNSIKDQEELRHYALSVPFYTHFTSPIRRYPDCIVHRLLHASIKNLPLPRKWNSLLCAKIATNCNAKKYSAKVAQEQSTELYFTFLLELRGPTSAQAVVMDVKDRSIDVIIIDVGLKTRIYIADVEDEVNAEYSTEHSAPTIKLNWKKTGLEQVINVFSIIDVLIQKHPSFFRLHGLILPPSTISMNMNRKQKRRTLK